MSDAAFRVWVCSFTYCARQRPVTGCMTDAQAMALVRKLGKTKKVIDELVKLRGWERTEDGYLVHDYDQYVDRGSQQRTAEWRARRRHGDAPSDADGDAGVTSQPRRGDGPRDGSVTLARDPVPEPVPIPQAPPTSGLAPPVAPPRGPAHGLTTETAEVRAWGERFIHHGRIPSGDDLEFLRRVPYAFDRLGVDVVLAAIDDVAAKHLLQGKPMPRAKYLVGKLGDLQAAAADAGVRPRGAPRSQGLTRLGAMLPGALQA